MENEWELLGHAAVDSGQLLLIDPAYIDRRWQYREFRDIRIYENKHTGDRLQYRVHFGNYQDPIARYGNLTMNELNETGDWFSVPPPQATGLNYDSVTRTTLEKERGGQIDLGVAFSTGWGDGNYPVHVKRNEDGRIMQVLINFGDEE